MNPNSRSGRFARRAAALAVLVLLLVPAGATLAQSPAPSRAANQPNGGPDGTRNGRAYVPADSGPSAEALRVLATIPEPLAPAERVAAPGGIAAADTARPGAPADTAAADTSGAAAESPPVPAPTQPLGDTTRTVPGYSEAPPATPPVAGSEPAAAPAELPDTCWAVQIASPSEKARAEKLREAGESLLLVRMLVEPSKNRFAVRTSDCLDGAAADSLRLRALATGFKDAFRVKWVRGKAGR